MGKFHTPYHFAPLTLFREVRFLHPLFFTGRENFHPLTIFQDIFTPLMIFWNIFTPLIFSHPLFFLEGKNFRTPYDFSENFHTLKFFDKNFAPLKKHSDRVSGLKKDRPLKWTLELSSGLLFLTQCYVQIIKNDASDFQ